MADRLSKGRILFLTLGVFGIPILVLGPLLAPIARAAPVAEFDVPASGETVTATLPPGGYLVRASGTYTYRSFPEHSYADAARSFGADGHCRDFAENLHDLLMNGESPWAGCASSHVYTTTLYCPTSCQVGFRIHDDEHNDNSGSLHVAIETFRELGLWVDADGTEIAHTLPPGIYTLTAYGTYKFGYGSQSIADASKVFETAPCREVPNDLLDLIVGLELRTGGSREVSPWAGCDPLTHRYVVGLACDLPCPVRFRIKDDYYADNWGGLGLVIQLRAPWTAGAPPLFDVTTPRVRVEQDLPFPLVWPIRADCVTADVGSVTVYGSRVSNRPVNEWIAQGEGTSVGTAC